MSSFTDSRQRFHRPARLSMNALIILVRNLVAVVQVWRARARLRRDLAALGERELQDMGTCWSSIADEVSKPFWRK
jgi:uncharacterized protein YjiS (DUF1127 family)